ncbi:hypothetical protein D9M71_626330 [compost metagenome]
MPPLSACTLLLLMALICFLKFSGNSICFFTRFNCGSRPDNTMNNLPASPSAKSSGAKALPSFSGVVKPRTLSAGLSTTFGSLLALARIG